MKIKAFGLALNILVLTLKHDHLLATTCATGDAC